MMPLGLYISCAALAACLPSVSAVIVNETSTLYTFSNDRLSFDILKKNGYIRNLLLDGFSVLGSPSGNAGQLYTGKHRVS